MPSMFVSILPLLMASLMIQRVGGSISSIPSTTYVDELRPIYHLTYDKKSSGNLSYPPLFTANATQSFVNDPNGLLVFNGNYHVFGQWGENGHAGATYTRAV
jgi:sucrose-6-phosphate hydrolase SacC (GH32 family)